MTNNFIELPQLSKKLTELFNRPYYFYKDIVYFCEEQKVGEYKNVKFFVNSNDHTPLHFHIKTTNPDGEYRIFLTEDYTIEKYDTIFGKPISSRINKSVTFWYEEQNGKKDVLEALHKVGII